MAQAWTIDGPKVIDIGDENERVRALRVALVGGRVDVLTHHDSPTARVEVLSASTEPSPPRITWDGSTVRISHGDPISAVQGLLARLGVGEAATWQAELSISVPAHTSVEIVTVSAPILVTGVSGDVSVATVSGDLTLSDIDASTRIKTVSGNAACAGLVGALDSNTVSGDVTVRGSRLATISSRSVSGGVLLDLTRAPSKVNATTVSGDLTMRVPRLDGYDISAKGVAGQVVVNGHQYPINRKSLHLVEGDGALRVEVHSVSGRLEVLSDVTDTPVTMTK